VGRLRVQGNDTPAKILTPPEHGATEQAWTARALPQMQAVRYGGCGVVMSDGRYAYLGGTLASSYAFTATCEALVLRHHNDHHAEGGSTETEKGAWEPLPAMLEARCQFACAALRGCIIVAGGMNRASAEIYEVGQLPLPDCGLRAGG